VWTGISQIGIGASGGFCILCNERPGPVLKEGISSFSKELCSMELLLNLQSICVFNHT
jgi:hypothetical protein